MATYKCWDEGASEEFDADSMGAAQQHAEEWLRGGDWSGGETAKTCWVHAHVAEIDDDGEIVSQERVTVAIDPEEPVCIDDDGHDWQSPVEIVGGCRENPGVWGHGGGVVVAAVCLRCGCERRTDTWAQDPSNGEQGMESIEYRPRFYADRLAELAAQED